jgi:hypothetical protein
MRTHDTGGASLFGFLLSGLLSLSGAAAPACAAELRFRAEELPARLTVGYAVCLLDLSGDGKEDIAIVDSKRFLWLESPAWKEHVIHEEAAAPFDNVCFAPADLDRDGRIDFAVGRDWQFNNTRSGGTIGWLRAAKEKGVPWTYHPIGEEPTTHRMRFVDLDVDGRDELVVVPLKGRDTAAPDFAERGVRVFAYTIPADPLKGPWQASVLDDGTHVTHNFCHAGDLAGGEKGGGGGAGGGAGLLLASFEGVTLLERGKDGAWRRTRVGAGDQESRPNRGASEVRMGRLGAGAHYIATIEPWHGDKVVVYTRPAGPRPEERGDWLWKREVLDQELKWGHAVWCADLDGDPDEELVIGVRDDLDEKRRRGLRIYDPADREGAKWTRALVDPGGVAIEDLAVGDLDGDGRRDIVAVGRQTHNVKVYWNETE